MFVFNTQETLKRIAILVFNLQETMKLFADIDSLASRPPSKEKTKLMSLILEYDLVELTKEMWGQYLTKDRLETMTQLPPHLYSSMHVIMYLFIR